MGGGHMISIARREVQKDIVYRFERVLRGQSDVRVSIGEEVSPETIVATGWERAGFRTFNLSELFGVDVKNVSDTLVKTIGTHVYKGEIIARKKELFGLREKVFKSPINGIFVNFEEDSSRITMQYLPQEVRTIAGVFGKVSAIVPQERVSIEAHVNAIQGVVSFGIHREGGLQAVGYRDIPIQSDQLRDEFAGKILFGGSGITIDALYKSLSLGVEAIVTGGINYEDYLRLTGSKGRYEDIGLSLLAVEGFGVAEIPPEIFELLQNSEHEHVFFEPKDSLLILPGSKTSTRTTHSALPWQNFTLIKEGQHARILGNEYYSYHGIVKTVDEDSDKVVIELTNNKKFETSAKNIEIILNN